MNIFKFFLSALVSINTIRCAKDFVSGQPEAVPLTSDIDTKDWVEFRSDEHGIVFKYPSDWAVASLEGLAIIVAENEKDIYSLNQSYSIRAMKPYMKRGNQNLNIPQSTNQVAQALADTWIKTGSQLTIPVTDVDINGHAGAIFSAEVNSWHNNYTIVLRLTNHKVVDLSVTGEEDKIEEMQNTLNALALTIQPLQN